MRKKLLISIVLLAVSICVLLVSCDNYRQNVRDIGNSFGVITTKDLNYADFYRKGMVSHINNTIFKGQYKVTQDQVRVKAGSGVTHVMLSGITDESVKQKIRDNFAEIKTKNPQGSPLIVKFR